MGVSFDHGVSLSLVSSFSNTFQAKNRVRNAPANTALTQISHCSHNAHTTNHHLCGSEEKNGEQR